MIRSETTSTTVIGTVLQISIDLEELNMYQDEQKFQSEEKYFENFDIGIFFPIFI